MWVTGTFDRGRDGLKERQNAGLLLEYLDEVAVGWLYFFEEENECGGRTDLLTEGSNQLYT